MRGSADVGTVTLSLGETERHTRDKDPPGETEEARTRGYDAKPTQVRVRATTDVGDVAVTVR